MFSVEHGKACIKIVACICARDGVISSAEENVIFSSIAEKFPDIDEDIFESVLNEFFESNEQIEDYLREVTDGELREFTLYLAELSASADGLDPRENIALKKARLIWSGSQNA